MLETKEFSVAWNKKTATEISLKINFILSYIINLIYIHIYMVQRYEDHLGNHKTVNYTQLKSQKKILFSWTQSKAPQQQTVV